jgi:methionyl-tRNA formyltransferase
MRILFLGNNRLGWQVLQWLKQQNEEIVGLVIHPPHEQRFAAEIISVSGLAAEQVFDGSRLRNEMVLESVKALKPDLGISIMFGYILRSEFLNVFPKGCINLHPAYLPYNRGAYPNVWSIIDETLAGVTLHYVDPGVDTGAIIAQREIVVEPIDTGASLYSKLERAALALFKETWPLFKADQIKSVVQPIAAGTYHRIQDVERIDQIDLDATYKAKELLNILRARTFRPYPGAYFVVDGRKVYLRLELTYGEQAEASG